MCGIAGKINFDSTSINSDLLLKMCRTMRHRGPDDQGIYINSRKSIGLGSQRLSIIDINTGHQPICNEDKSIWVVFNGEIYNYRILREELISKGHKFYTKTDTEVLVHLYEEHGNDFVRRIDGMFGIALWDENKNRLLLVRDRMGIKPLFYYHDARRLLFGSELKAILEDDVPCVVDKQAVYDYFSFNFVPAPRSIYRDIKKILPGYILDCTDGRITQSRYWDMSVGQALDNKRISESESIDELNFLIKESVRSHLISDVPIGVFLSGGLDSSLITMTASSLMEEQLKTFNIAFSDSRFDESKKAQVVARQFGTLHKEYLFAIEDVLRARKFIDFFDEPFADSSAVAMFCVSRIAHPEVKVVLCGEGGDELFGGYITYQADKLNFLYQKLPVGIRKLIARTSLLVPVSHGRASLDYRLKRFTCGSDSSLIKSHYNWKVIFDEDEKKALFSDEFLASAGFTDTFSVAEDICRQAQTGTSLDKVLYLDSKLNLVDDILTKTDRMTMANSIEARVPLLDRALVEFVAGLPFRLKVKGMTTKYILRKALRNRLPAVITNQKKAGFSIPVSAWLRNELKGMVYEVMAEDKIRDTRILNPSKVALIIRQHMDGKKDNSRQIWGLFNFMLWFDKYAKRLSI